ncbi:hypothetical protein [Flavobacterium sp. 3HN19-14]|uniref:hypothetical protein n=1 Tax=Flavobacterium sp. 3HN19-14 TaxID=3448133 RepID=UPI003EDFF576
MMSWKDKFGTELEGDEPWYNYGNKINGFLDDNFVQNTADVTDPDNAVVVNKNVVSPQLFLLSPLFYAMQSIGFKISGSFVDHPFIRRLLLLSTKDNLTKILLLPTITPILLDGEWQLREYGSYFWFRRTHIFEVDEDIEVTVKFRFVLAAQTDTSSHPVKTSFRMKRIYYPEVSGIDPYPLEEEITFNRKDNVPGEIIEAESSFILAPLVKLHFDYFSINMLMPESYSIEVYKKDAEHTYYQMHPTIPVSRYVPDWTFGNYLNELKKFANLEIIIDDFKKEMRLDFGNDFMLRTEKHISMRSLKVLSYEQAPNTAYIFKYSNEEDAGLYVTSSGTEAYAKQLNDFAETVESKFKLVPHNGSTAELSEAVESKSGVGLMIYDPENEKLISTSFLGQNLKIGGEGGIYDSYYKIFTKFRLNAGQIDVAGAFTKTEMSKITKLKKIFLDNQEYIVESTEYVQTKQDNYELKLRLESVNY